MTFRSAYLLAMVALVMMVASGPAFAQTDYDSDNDNYIEVSTLAQLNAIRWDIDGNGRVSSSDSTNYFTAFSGTSAPNTATGMGCASTCTGYELINDLDFDTSGDDTITAADDYWNGGAGWDPLGIDTSQGTSRYSGDFKGNGHTIDNLFVNRSSRHHFGLFGATHTSSRIEDLYVTNANVRGNNNGGIMVGYHRGVIVACYTTGKITGVDRVGGMTGINHGTIHSSYSTAAVSTSGQFNRAGGLIGRHVLFSSRTTNSYATGLVTVTGSGVIGGGLVATHSGGVVSNSYWDLAGFATSASGVGKTTAELQGPTGYTGIYAAWNVDLDGDRLPDNPWNFGTSSDYPTLNTPAQREQAIDYDNDNDGLIDVNSLEKLNAIRHDLNGDGVPTDTTAYARAFPGGQLAGAASTLMGCTSGCTGYELTANLDFDTNGDNMVTAADAYPNWSPIGGSYAATFNGRGHTISNLTINSTSSGHTGLFTQIASGGVVRDVGMIDASINAQGVYTGILVGSNLGTIIAAYSGGSITYTYNGGAVGGLAGGNSGTIRASYSTASVDGGTSSSASVGGLMGYNDGGTTIASYAAGQVSGTGASTNFGGLMGQTTGGATVITNSYCDTSINTQCIGYNASTTASAMGYTTAQLQGPTGYTGIYANWNIDLDSDSSLDFPWNFGTSSQYPTLNTPSERVLARQVRVSISSGSVPEGAAGTNTRLRFTVQLHKASTQQVTVAYADAGTGTAESGTDYTALAGGTLTFAAGETSKTIDVSIIGDATVEPDETVIVTLSSPSSVDVILPTPPSATGTITNDDQPGTEPEPDPDPTFTEAIDPQSYPQGRAIDPLPLPEAADGTGTLTYALTPDLPEGLSFDAETLTVSGTPTEASEKAIYTLTATDEDGDAAEVSFFLTISANLIPSFGDASVDAQALMRKQAIDALTLPQATGGDAPLTYALTPDLPAGLKFDAETRVLSGTPLEAMDETTYTLTATDSDGDEATLTFTLSVTTDPIPIFGDTTIAAQGYQHQAFAPLTLPQASGGDEPLTYTLNPDPPLPEGLKFDGETLTVSGTPLKAMDEMTYTLTATDDNGDEVHLMFTLEIPDLMPTFGDTTIAAQSYLVNQEIESLTLPEASSGDGMLVYILLPSLPDGISFNPDTRTLSGMPTAEKDMATYTLSALDTDGDVASLPFTLEVSLPSPDFDGDGVVNFADFLTFADKFGSRLGQERYDARCDFNGDGEIGFGDFLLLAADFGG